LTISHDDLDRYRSLDGLGIGVFTGEFSFEQAKQRIAEVMPYLTEAIAGKLYNEFQNVTFFITRSQDYQDAQEWLELISWTLEQMTRYLIKGKLTAVDPTEYARPIIAYRIQLDTVRDFILYGLEQYEANTPNPSDV